jgi:hypothetical protein
VPHVARTPGCQPIWLLPSPLESFAILSAIFTRRFSRNRLWRFGIQQKVEEPPSLPTTGAHPAEIASEPLAR